VRFRYERGWQLAMGADALWAALEDTASFPRWWAWLRDADLPSLTEGADATFAVAAPLGYAMRLGLRLVEVVPGERIVATVDGDLVGRAELQILPDGPDTTTVVLRWDLALQRRLMRVLGWVARRVLESGHEWVVDAGVTSFAAAHQVRVVELAPPTSPVEPVVTTPRRVVVDAVVAGLVAGALSGLPSTAVAVVRRRRVLEATRAAGSLLGSNSVPRGVVAHGAVSIGWALLLSALWPRRASPAAALALGAGVGAAIAAVDLGVVAPRRFPAIAALARAPQVTDHVLFGVVVAAVLVGRTGAASSGRRDAPHQSAQPVGVTDPSIERGSTRSPVLPAS
jgi:uncharacterized protein YndB with AHSA1/START domain